MFLLLSPAPTAWLISSSPLFAAVIATGAVALLGYTTTMPQPTDPCTSAIFWMTLSLKFGLPLIGWVITLVAMRECPLTKEEMVNVQKRIAEKKGCCAV